MVDLPGTSGNIDDTDVNMAPGPSLNKEISNIHDKNNEPPASFQLTPPKKNFRSPEQFRGFPKAAPRKMSDKGRAKGRSMIATDTPVKAALSQKKMKTASQNKPKDTVKRTKTQPKAKPPPRRKLYDADSESSEDSESDRSNEPIFDDSDDDSDILVFDPTSEGFKDSAHEGDYVLAEFKTTTKKTVYYIGKVLKDKDDNGDYEISFLQASKKMSGKFVFPLQPKIEMTNEDCITMVLPQPTSFGKTKRQKEHYTFGVDFGNIQIR
jgi:hypothetical protein